MDQPWLTNWWHVSPVNFLPDVVAQTSFSPNLAISDCTLRDGEQQAGVVFTKDDKLEVAKALDRLGVHEIESGMPAVSKEDREAVEAIAALGLNAKISVLARAIKDDVDVAADCGAWAVSISLPIGDLQRKYKLHVSEEAYLGKCLEIAAYAKSKGLYVTLSPYDTTRVQLDFLEQVLNAVKAANTVDRVRLVDTVGAAHPLAMRYLVRFMKSVIGDLPIEVHCHDDFGMAVANTLAALEAGAEVASVTVNGIGERSGNCPLEEVVTALRILYDVDAGIRLERLKEVSETVQAVSGIRLQPHKAVVGRNSFVHESGMVVAGLLKHPFTAEPYAPEIVGQKRTILIGKKSGAQSVKWKLEQLGHSPTEGQIEECLEQVKRQSLREKRALTDEELSAIYAHIAGMHP